MSYPNLSQINDPALARAIKIACDRLAAQERLRRSVPSVPVPTTTIPGGAQRFTGLASPQHEQDGITRAFMTQSVEQAISDAVALVHGTGTTPPTNPGPQPPPQPPSGGGVPVVDITKGQPGGIPPAPNLRWFRGNMCGIRVPGLPFVRDGLSEDTTLFLTWFLDRYGPADQATIFAAYAAHNYTHMLVSWSDSRTHGGVPATGQTPAQFVATVQAIQAAGIYPVIFLIGKDQDPRDMDGTSVAPIVDPAIDALLAAGGNMIFCVGWELNLFNSPEGLQSIINHIAGKVVPRYPLYVHFSEDVMAWQPDGQFTSYFWQQNVGKLTGLFHQKRLSQDEALYQARLADVQNRFGGAFGFPSDSGFGHPFDVVACECTAMLQFNPHGISEAAGDRVGFIAICSPGLVPVMGFNNGAQFPNGTRP